MRADLVLALRSRSVNVLTALEAGMISRDDQAHLRLASEQGRVLYSSFNVGHFYGIHEAWMSSGRSHAGIILAEQKRYSVGGQMRRLLRIVESRTLDSMRNRAEFLGVWGAR